MKNLDPFILSILLAGLFVLGLIIYEHLYYRPLKKQPQPSYSFAKRAKVGGIEFHYTQTGQGPHLLLIHGIAANIYVWRFLIEKLSRRFTVTAVDLPGFGLSSKDPTHHYGLDDQAERVVQFLNLLGIKKANLVGSSMGGAIALWLARLHPERFPAVATLAPATNPKLVFFNHTGLEKAVGIMTGPLQRLVTPYTVKKIMKRVIGREDLIHEESIQNYLKPYLDNGDSLATFIKSLHLLRDERLPHEFKNLQSRVLILWGEKDAVVARRFVQQLHSILPQSEFIVHPEAGHHPMEDQPDWVLEQLLRFFSATKN